MMAACEPGRIRSKSAEGNWASGKLTLSREVRCTVRHGSPEELAFRLIRRIAWSGCVSLTTLCASRDPAPVVPEHPGGPVHCQSVPEPRPKGGCAEANSRRQITPCAVLPRGPGAAGHPTDLNLPLI